MIYILLYTYTPAIDLVLIAYLDSMTMTSFNIFKARVVIFKKLKVNAKMQIEAWVLVVGGSFGLADYYIGKLYLFSIS